jgi:spermidine/putrescine transport system permease protein
MNERHRPPPPRSIAAFLPLMLVALYLPLVVMLIASFTDVQESGAVFTLRWYFEVFSDPDLWEALSRSLLVAGGSAVASTVLGLLSALAIDKWGFRARAFLRALSGLSLMLPELVLALALLSWFALFGLNLSLWTVIAAHITLTVPFVTLIIGARLKGLEPAYDDAARDLGAREWQVLVRVTLPLLSPAILAGFLLTFLISFDDFLVTFYTNGAGSDTLPVRLYSMMKQGMSPKIQALSSIMLIVSIVLIGILVRLRGLIARTPGN